MARAIDANELMVEIQVCSWDSEQDKERAEDLVLGMPTLTPPNEPLTLEDAKKERYIWFMVGGKDRQKNRAKTFPGLAKAMAEQWGRLLPPEGEKNNG